MGRLRVVLYGILLVIFAVLMVFDGFWIGYYGYNMFLRDAFEVGHP